jgi:hypothetical protein
VDTVTLRHAALSLGAVLLLCMAIYLYYEVRHEVRSQPAIAQVEPPPRPRHPAREESAPPPSTPAPPSRGRPQAADAGRDAHRTFLL